MLLESRYRHAERPLTRRSHNTRPADSAKRRWPVLAALSPADRKGIPALLARDAWVGELAADNPLLFFLLLRARIERKQPPSWVKEMARLRRRSLMTELGYEGSDSSERFLRRCRFTRLDVLEQLALRALVARPLPDWARHWRRPHLDLLTTLQYLSWPHAAQAMNVIEYDAALTSDMRSQGIVPDVSEEDYASPAVCLIKSLRRIEQLIYENVEKSGRPRVRRQWARCDTYAGLREFHDRLSDRCRDEWVNEIRSAVQGYTWPAAPFAGNDAIQPIVTVAMLIEEGRRMHHCIPSYVEEIIKGELYAYRVLSPQRATLMLVRGSDGQWKRDDIRATCNGSVSFLTTQLVDEWLMNARNR